MVMKETSTQLKWCLKYFLFTVGVTLVFNQEIASLEFCQYMLLIVIPVFYCWIKYGYDFDTGAFPFSRVILLFVTGTTRAGAVALSLLWEPLNNL